MNEVTPVQDITDEPFAVIADHLVAHVGRCTCDGPFETYGHRPGCGYEPIMTLDELAAVLAKAGRVVVDLPEPDDRDEYGPRWDSVRDMPIRVEVDGGSPAVWDCDADMAPEDAERHGLALVAAAREARRLAAERSGGVGGDTQ